MPEEPSPNGRQGGGNTNGQSIDSDQSSISTLSSLSDTASIDFDLDSESESLREVKIEILTFQASPVEICENKSDEFSNDRQYFRDNTRLIDFILVYTVHSKASKEAISDGLYSLYRLRYESALRKHGLELEYEPPEKSMDGKTGYIKIHTPFHILQRQAEMKKIPKPFKEIDADEDESWLRKLRNRCCTKNPFALQDEYRLPKKEFFCEPFQRAYRSEFLGHDDKNTFFTSAERAYLTWDMLKHTKVRLEERKSASIFVINVPQFIRRRLTAERVSHLQNCSNLDGQEGIELRKQSQNETLDDEDAAASREKSDSETEQSEIEETDRTKLASIQLLINMGIYKDAFPLHDGDLNGDNADKSQRKYLYESWARLGQWRRRQPLSVIRDYYGEKMAMYFAFTGFYTKMLIFPSIMGVLVMIYSVLDMNSDLYSDIICNNKEFADLIICPDCPTSACAFTKVNQFCETAKIEVIFDSDVIILACIFMTMWSICFLEFWKRYRSKLCADWNLTDYNKQDGENIRPEYMLRAPDVKLNPVTMKMEPYLTWYSKFKRILASVATVVFFISVVLGLLAAIIVYKEVGGKWWMLALRDEDSHRHIPYSLIVSITASVGNGIFIAIMTLVYAKLAWFLTCAEFPRTDNDFEHSYAYKVFIFQCVNYYGALFYLAFYRGQVAPPPHEQTYFDSMCPISGCVVDVSIQLIVIFTGKQAVSNIIEIGVPFLSKQVASLKRRRWRRRNTELKKQWPPWERDYHLASNHRVLLFSDYLQLLIQYGFVTMFSAVFPLAPLFAMINNVIEIRSDAYKNIALTRRCIPARSGDIGPWYNCLKFFTKLAVLTNVTLISFTSNFIDRLTYSFVSDQLENNAVLKNQSIAMAFGLSLYRTSDFYKYVPGQNDSLWRQHEYCYYVAARYPPDDEVEPYAKTLVWWYRLVLALFIFCLFENAIFLFQKLLAFFIPDTSESVRTRLGREKYLSRMNFLRREFGVKEIRELRNLEKDEDEDEDFVPDELPPWLNSPVPKNGNDHPNLAAPTQRRLKKRSPRGKMIPRRKDPFLVVVFRKLTLCD